MKTMIAVLLGMALAGCASNTARFSERTAEGVTTTFETRVLATAGSKLAEGAGSMDYQGPDWQLKVGGAASGLEAGGDVNQAIRDLGSLAGLAEQLAGLRTPSASTGSTANTVLQQVIDALRPTLEALVAARLAEMSTPSGATP